MASNDKKTICGICKRELTDPRILPCSHIFCFRCICSKISYRNRNFVCPSNDGTVIAENDIDSLPVGSNISTTNNDQWKDNDSNHTSGINSAQSQTDNDAQNSIYISGLPVDMYFRQAIQILFDLFRNVGRIKFDEKRKKLLIYVPTHKLNSKKLLGTATITFEDEECVHRATEIYNGQSIPELNGSKIYVDKKQIKNGPSTQPKTDVNDNSIVINGLPTNMDRVELYRALSNLFLNIGRIKINPQNNRETIELHTGFNDRTKFIGRAKITFEEEESVEKAIKTYDGKNISSLNNSRIFITKPGEQPRRMDNENNNPGSIYITGLPTDMSEQELHEALNKIFNQNQMGPIKIDLQTNELFIQIDTDNSNPNRLLGTALITFEKEQSVQKAIDKYNGQSVPILHDRRISLKKSYIIPKSINRLKLNKKTNLNLNDRQQQIEIDVWFLIEGCDASQIRMKSTSIVDDLKRAIFQEKNQSHFYQAFFRDRQLDPGETIPKDTKSDKPVIIQKIQSTTNQHINHIQTKNNHLKKNYHIVVDNSNIIIGAKVIPGTNEINQKVRVNVNQLFQAIREDKFDIEIKTRIVAGSKPVGVGKTRVEEEWDLMSFKLMFVEREKTERFVDNALHGMCLEFMCNYDTNDTQQVLVLLTGDGNDNSGQTSFRRVVEIALTKHWHVELWSWKSSLHNVYKKYQQKHDRQMTINYLDPFRDKITFIQK